MSEKKSMGAGKIVLIVLGGLAVAGMGSCFVCTAVVGTAASEVAEQAEKKEKAEEAAAEECRDATAVKWDALAAELKENEARVAKKWKGKCQKVSGVVKTIDSGFGDKPIVIIQGEAAGFSLNNLRCKPKNEDKALELSKGKPITVWGLGGDEMLGSLRLDRCEW